MGKPNASWRGILVWRDKDWGIWPEQEEAKYLNLCLFQRTLEQLSNMVQVASCSDTGTLHKMEGLMNKEDRFQIFQFKPTAK